MKKVCFILTAEFAVKAFLLNHLTALSDKYALTVIVNTKNPAFLEDLGVNAQVVALPISRKINPISDLLALVKLVYILYQHQFDAVHTLMPKAGLIGNLAARFVCVPVRVHTFTGQVWVSRKGLSRFLLKQIDKLIARLTTINLVDGHGQRAFLIDQKILTQSNSQVFLNGSIAGVDLDKFQADTEVRAALRQSMDIETGAVVFLYIGRLNHEKGLLDLAKAFSALNTSAAHLIFVGPDEGNLQALISNLCNQKINQLHFVDYTSHPESYMCAADVLCLPSYREGFNNVIIEAAAVGLPAIASNIYGVTDAVKHHSTGLLHEVKNVEQIQQLMQALIDEPDLRQRLGSQAKSHTRTHYNAADMTKAWIRFYESVVG